jgi:hypothetical protein
MEADDQALGLCHWLGPPRRAWWPRQAARRRAADLFHDHGASVWAGSRAWHEKPDYGMEALLRHFRKKTLIEGTRASGGE